MKNILIHYISTDKTIINLELITSQICETNVGGDNYWDKALCMPILK